MPLFIEGGFMRLTGLNTNRRFNVGVVVRCVHGNDHFKVGKLYKVRMFHSKGNGYYSESTSVEIEDVTGNWYAPRFELVHQNVFKGERIKKEV